MTIEATRQADNILPPRRSLILAITVDATARAYDLSGITMGGSSYLTGQQGQRVYLTMQADGASMYYHFSSSSATTLDNTAVIAAAGTIAYANTYGAKLESGTSIDLRIDRITDRYLVLKCASGATGTIRIWASSQPSASAQ